MEPVSAREFDTAIKSLSKTMDEGFHGLNERLDTLNGKTSDNLSDIRRIDPVIAAHGEKIRNLDREVFGRRRDDDEQKHEQERNERKEPDDKPVTRREVNIVVAVATTVLVVIIWLFTAFGPQMANGAK